MKSFAAFSLIALLLLRLAATSAVAQIADENRLRELRDKAHSTSLTAAEQTEVTRGTEASRAAARERQARELEQIREAGRQAVAAAATRTAPSGPAREFFVNNETGDDKADGLAATKGTGGPVRTLAKAVSLLRPGDTLHLAVTREPYHDYIRLVDGFGGVPGKPIVIDGHGATITGCDPLRLDDWVEAGAPGLYKSAKMLSELDENNDASKLLRVFFVFDGVVQHMGRTSKGERPAFRSPTDLRPGEWTYAESEKTFYLKVSGKLADAKVEAPYRSNGLATRGAKIAVTNVVVKNLIVCHVLNDGFNIHGACKDVLLQNIAAYECGDDGLSPHETCEVTIDGFWSIGNSTGMCNINASVVHARNIWIEGNLSHQLMTAHAALTEVRDSVIVAQTGTQPVNITNSQKSRLTMDNVQISSPDRQKILLVTDAAMAARRLTVVGSGWEIRGNANVSESVLAGAPIALVEGGTWDGSRNIYTTATTPPKGEKDPMQRIIAAAAFKASPPPFPGVGANTAEFKIPPRPVPHPGAGKFTALGP